MRPPFVVVDKPSDLTYRIKQGPDKRARIIHHARFKLYVPQELENDHSWLNELPDTPPVHLPTRTHIPESRQVEDAEITRMLEGDLMETLPYGPSQDVPLDITLTAPETRDITDNTQAQITKTAIKTYSSTNDTNPIESSLNTS